MVYLIYKDEGDDNMVIKRDGNLKIVKDGTSYYRVMEGRKRIGSFLNLSDAEKYMEKRKNI